MAQGNARNSRKEQQWRRWLQQWQRSGQSVRAFCGSHGLSEPSFYAWRRELQRRGEQQAEQAPAFLPVRILPEESARPAYPFEVILANGRILRVAGGGDRATLQHLLAVLEEAASC